MKTKNKIKSEMREHGSKARFKAIKGAKNPHDLAVIINKQHDAGKLKCKKCGKHKKNCVC